MPDLRALLGDDRYDDEVLTKATKRALLGDDRYDEVLTKATKRALFNYPNLPISIVEHEALAAQALAAVLPDLLAEANTRADEAEAKARRFANLLGNNAKALNDVLPREVLRQKAEAWDEGHHAGHEDARAVQPTYPDPTTNPYRRGTEGESDRG